MNLVRGSVVVVTLDPTVGHEQQGVRPCIVVSAPAVLEEQRFPLVAVVPVTGTRCVGRLYPKVIPGPSGLRKDSWALVDQVRSVDKRRVTSVFGALSPEELQAIDDALARYLGLRGP